MEAVASVTDRILQIQSRIAQLSPAQIRTQGSALAPPATSVTSTASSSAAFGSVMDQAVAQAARTSSASGTTSAAASAGPSGASAVGSGKALVNGKGIPTELLRHGNGRIPSEALSPVAGADGHRLWTPAARSLEAMRAAAARDGVTIGMTDSYRTYETQVDLVRRKGLYSQGGLAAVPGTSDHGWGIAVDLKLDSRAQTWMRTHGGEYGFVEDVPREPWHWAYRPTH